MKPLLRLLATSALALVAFVAAAPAHATDWKVWDFTASTELNDWTRNGGVTYTQAWDSVTNIVYTLTAGNSDLRSEYTPAAPQPDFATYPYITYTVTVSGIPSGANLRFRPREFVTDSTGTNYGSYLTKVTDLANGTYQLTVNLTDPANYVANGSPHVFSPSSDWLFRTRTIFDITTIPGVSAPAVYGALGLKVDKIVITDTAPSDTTAPTGTIQINGGATTTNYNTVTLALSATDNVGGLGVADYRLSNDNVTFGAWQPYTTSTSWALSSGDGAKTVYVQYRDAAANVSTGTISANITVRTLWDFVTNAEATAGDWPQSRVPAQWTQTWDGTSSQVWNIVAAPNSDFRSDYILPTPKLLIKNSPYVTYKLTISGVPSGSNVNFQPRNFVPDATGVDARAYSGQVWPLTNGTYTLTVTLTDPAQYVVNGSNQTLDTNLGTLFKSSTRINFQTVAGISTPAVYNNVKAAIDYVNFTSTAPSDTTAPTGTVQINGGATTTNSTAVTLTLNAADNGGGIGLADYRLSNDNTTFSVWQPYTTSVPWTLSAGAGAKTVYVQYRDASANVSTGTISAGITLDTTAPTATTIVPTTTGPTNATSVDFTVTFSEPVQNFNNAADVVLTQSGTASTGVTITGGPTVYTATVTGISGNGTLTLAVNPASDVQDLAANALASSVTSAAVTIDNTAPNAVTISPVTASPTNATSVDFTVTFDEAVQNFNSASDLVVTAVGASNTGATISGGPTTYTVTLTGVTGDGTLAIAVNTGSDVQDLAGNALASSFTSGTITIDNTSPAPALSSTAGDPVGGGITIDVDTGEATTDLAAADFTPVNATITAFTGSGSSYSFTLNPISVGVFSVSLGASKYTDAAGNANTAAPANVSRTYDTTQPSATVITPSTTGPTNASSISFAITFNKAVLNFNNAADLVITHNGTANTAASISGSGTSYTVNVTGITGDGDFTLAVNTASDVKDALNNTLASSVTSASVVIDHTAPGIALSTTAGSVVNAPVTVNVLVSETVSTFDAGDLTLTNASASSFTGSGDTYSFTLTPIVEGAFSVRTNAAAFADAAGNTSTASNVLSLQYDTTAPTVALQTTAAEPTSAAITVNVTLGESVSTFSASDLTTQNASASNFTGSGDTYSFTLTPTGQGTFGVQVAAASFTDAAGNTNTASNTLTRTFDSNGPVFSNITVTPNQASDGEQVTITFDSSEDVLSDPDVTVNGHPATRSAKSAFTYSYTVSPTDPLGPATIEVQGLDLAGNAGSFSTTAAFTVIQEVVPVPAAGSTGLLILSIAIALGAAYNVVRGRRGSEDKAE